jgi:dTDP-4-dehydrorhamnose reductase
MRRRVLITGSSGMLGIDLCKELGKDYEVWGMDIIDRHSSFVVHFVKADITDKEETIKAIVKAKPDIVIHAAAYTDVDGCELDGKKAFRINSLGTKNVALACRKAGATLVYISTDFVFNGKKTRPYIETDRPEPLSVYGESKLKGEMAVKSSLKNYFIIRTSWLYGANGKNFVDTIAAKAKTEKALKVVDDQAGSPTYTKDLAKALHALIDKCSDRGSRISDFGVYHISNSGEVSWYRYAKEILRITGSKTKVIPISSQELSRPAERPAMSVLDNSKFVKFTGYRMRPWRAALKEYLVYKGV